LNDTLVLVIAGLSHAGKTQFVDALIELTRSMIAPVLWVSFEAQSHWQEALEWSPRLQQHVTRPAYKQLVERLNQDLHRPVGSWVDVQFAHLPEPFEHHGVHEPFGLGQQDYIVFPPEIPPTHNHTAWNYGWRRLLEKHYRLVIVDGVVPWVLTPLRKECITSIWLLNTEHTAEQLAGQWQRWPSSHLPLAGGVLLNESVEEEGIVVARHLFNDVQALVQQHETLQWLGRLPKLHPASPRTIANQQRVEQLYLDSVQLALQRLLWEGSPLFQ
jgi:hypothetical protein